MNKIILFDPSISNVNIGDQIISESIKKEMDSILKSSYNVSISTHLPLSWYYMRRIKDADLKFVLGSNLLKSTFFGLKRQWAVGFSTSKLAYPSVLVGVGWWQYNNKPNLYTKRLLKKVLSTDYVHSVRDQYTADILNSIGIKAINTGCPTMWCLTEEFCKTIDTSKKDSVVFTLTDYNKDIERDTSMIKTLLNNYDNVYFWPQGFYDMEYYNELVTFENNIQVINPSLKSYDELLDGENIDYIGTRLHGGIRALQKKRRALIVSIDNRARELSKDFNVPILERENISTLSDWIYSEEKVGIKLPINKIKEWKMQFESFKKKG